MTESEFTACAGSHLSESCTTALTYSDRSLTISAASTGTGSRLIVDGSVSGEGADTTALTARSTDAVYIGENSRPVPGNAAFGEDSTLAAITLESSLSTNVNFINDGVIEIAPDRVSNGAVFTLVQNGGSGTAGLGTAESSNQHFCLDTGYRQHRRHRDLRLQQGRCGSVSDRCLHPQLNQSLRHQ